MINIKNQSYKIILLFTLLILFNCFTITSYAIDVDDDNQDTNKLPPNALYVSDFGQNGEGYIKIEWKTKNGDGIEEKGFLKYYKYILGYNANTKELLGLYLYNSSNSKHDEELQLAIRNKELDTNVLYDVYNANKGTLVKNPKIYTSAYFYWPVSSNNDFILTADNSDKENIIKKHDIHDFSAISDKNNFNLATIIHGNWDNTLSSNLPNYIYPIKLSSDNYNNWRKEVESKLGRSYARKYNVGNINRHFVNTSQDFLKHTSYYSPLYSSTGQQGGIELTKECFNNYDPSNDELNFNKKDKEYYSKQYTFFLTSPQGDILTPHKVFSATSLFFEDVAPTFSRSTSAALGVRYFININPSVAYQNGIVPNHFKFDKGSAIFNEELNKIVPNFSNTNNLSSLNYQDVPPLFLLTLNSTIYTYSGAYQKLYDLTLNNFTDINSVIPEFSNVRDIENFINLGKTNYKEYYKIEQALTLVLGKYFLINGFASSNSPATLLYINAPQKTTWGAYELPVLDLKNSVNAGNVTTGNVGIVNELGENINSSIIIIDLVKALSVSEQDYSYILQYNKQPSTISKRSFKLIQAAINNENIGAYLTDSEKEKGLIGIVDNSLEHLLPNRPYVIVASIMYKKNFLDQAVIPEIFTENMYNISTYKNIKLEEETKKEQTEETLKE